MVLLECKDVAAMAKYLLSVVAVTEDLRAKVKLRR